MNKEIIKLLEKYWKAETSLIEEATLKAYFSGKNIDTDLLPYKKLFSFYNVAGNMTTNLKLKTPQVSVLKDIDALITKYDNAESSIEEEAQLKAYFSQADYDSKYEAHAALFTFFDTASKMESNLDIEFTINADNSNIEILIEKYWNAETTVDEEMIINEYLHSSSLEAKHLPLKSIFAHHTDVKNEKIDLDLTKLFESQGEATSDDEAAPAAVTQKGTKVFSLRKMMTAVAAIFILGFAAITVMNQSENTDTQYKGKYVQLDEEAEAREAYEITKQALALLSKNMNQGSATVKTSVKKAESAGIFK